jgi:hypothetical protein
MVFYQISLTVSTKETKYETAYIKLFSLLWIL